MKTITDIKDEMRKIVEKPAQGEYVYFQYGIERVLEELEGLDSGEIRYYETLQNLRLLRDSEIVSEDQTQYVRRTINILKAHQTLSQGEDDSEINKIERIKERIQRRLEDVEGAYAYVDAYENALQIIEDETVKEKGGENDE